MEKSQFLKVLNYGIRGLIVLIGILLVSGLFKPVGAPESFVRIMGIIFILFGIYRLIIYRTQHKRYNFTDHLDDKYKGGDRDEK
ncbi:MAG: hypothetical protein ACLFR2_11255 [Candidatus Kapaibacterium sp.]